MNRPSIAALRRCAVALAGAIALAGLAGCFNPFSPRVYEGGGLSDQPDAPTTPQGVVRRLGWCWSHRAIDEYRELFTADYRFQFANGDSSGTIFQDGFLTREEEINTAENLFVRGTATNPPATSISLTLDPNLVDLPSSRGGDPKWHRSIKTQVFLSITTDEQDFRVQGQVEFFLVRGDSAKIPTELQTRFKPDSTRWWVERWEDGTVGAGDGGVTTGTPGAPPVVRATRPAVEALPVETTMGGVKRHWYERR